MGESPKKHFDFTWTVGHGKTQVFNPWYSKVSAHLLDSVILFSLIINVHIRINPFSVVAIILNSLFITVIHCVRLAVVGGWC